MVPDLDSRHIGFVCPHRKPCLLVRSPEQGNIGTDGNRSSKHLDVPGFNHVGIRAEAVELGFQKMMKIKILEAEPGLFYKIGTMIFSHGLSYPLNLKPSQATWLKSRDAGVIA